VIDILLPEGRKLLSFLEIYSLGKEKVSQNQVPTVEVIGALVSDVVTTVSESYLNSDIIPNCGGDLIEFKTDFLWDGCDWDYYDILKDVIKSHGEQLRDVLRIEEEFQITHDDLKQYLLTYKIGQLDRSPLINSDKILSTINEISNGSPFIKNGTLKAFNESGPLLITTGRISPQKGFETIFAGVPDIIQAIPNAKFVFLILPTDYSLDEIKKYAQFVKKYPNNIRIVFGVASDIFYLAHVAADAYCALSRWEPFGIMALEAMASKLPIIASRVGGLQETIIDINKDPERGTGILIEKDQPNEFAIAAISLLKASEVASYAHIGKKIEEEKLRRITDQIPNEIVRTEVSLNPQYYDKIKENCYLRVRNNFTWNIVSEKLKLIYLTHQTN
jgi:glycosyltransferase involved in cell wall biosynthesis